MILLSVLVTHILLCDSVVDFVSCWLFVPTAITCIKWMIGIKLDIFVYALNYEKTIVLRQWDGVRERWEEETRQKIRKLETGRWRKTRLYENILSVKVLCKTAVKDIHLAWLFKRKKYQITKQNTTQSLVIWLAITPFKAI